MSEVPGYEKELVIAYLVTEKLETGNSSGIEIIPITSDQMSYDKLYPTDISAEGLYLHGSRVISTIQAPFPTYGVKAWDVTGDVRTIGYEHPGLKQVNWERELREWLDENGCFNGDYKPHWCGEPPYKGSIDDMEA